MGVRSFFGNPIPLFFLELFFLVDPEGSLRVLRFFFGQSDSWFFKNFFFLSTLTGHSQQWDFFFFNFSLISSLAGVSSCADSSHRKRRVYSVAWSPDGILATGSLDKTIKLWNATTGNDQSTLSGNSGYVSQKTFLGMFLKLFLFFGIVFVRTDWLQCFQRQQGRDVESD
jgi:WD40 repeat protein